MGYSGCGVGFLVPLITTFCLVVSDFLSSWITGDANYHAHHPELQVLSFFMAALLVWIVGRRLNGNPNGTREYLLFFIRIEYWAFVLVVAGLVIPFLSH